MEGSYYISYDSDEYRGSQGTTSVGSETWRIENGEGAWQGSSTGVNFADGHPSVLTIALVGEGAYEGLTAIWESVYNPSGLCSWDVRGVIIEGGPPAVPEPFIGE
jgi:hypothetical protein